MRALALVLLAALSAPPVPALAGDAAPAKENPTVLSFTMNSIDGKPVDLAQYRGKVLLLVNTASKCGYTPQYAGLEALHEKYAAKGLALLGFPCNDFGAQEPGSNEEVATFCKKNYGVSFDLFSKIHVKGPEQAPLYAHLTTVLPDAQGDVKWNFEKFLVGRDGRVVARFPSKVTPDSPELVQALEAELAKPAN